MENDSARIDLDKLDYDNETLLSLPLEEIIRFNQREWRSVDRGVISRPMELSPIAALLHDASKEHFKEYLDPKRPKPIIGWSVLIDEPPIVRYVGVELDLEVIQRQRLHRVALNGINEMVTDELAIDLISGTEESPLHLLLKPYALAIEKIKKNKGVSESVRKLFKDLKLNTDPDEYLSSLREAYFLGQNERLSRLIQANTPYDSLAEATQSIAKRDGLYEKDYYSNGYASVAERIGTSMGLNGLYRHPGIVEIVTFNGPMWGTLLSASASPASYAFGPAPVALAFTTAMLPTFLKTPYVAVHEFMHELSTTKDRVGLMPAKLQVIE